ncbi:MAG: hypothetical protein DRI77_15300 [Chloroflexi bacterium]|nr:MAG: hypothetical protein DRI77_15300 [Chloroflexota bacterium]
MDERLRILELIEAGEISVEEGARRLKSPEPTASSEEPAPHPTLVRWLWQVTFWIGAALMAWGGWLLASSYTGEITTGRLVWAWLILTLGVLGVMLGWWLQRARWLYVRVRQSDGPNITIAFPLPLGLVAWGLRIAQPFVPQLGEMKMDELLLALRDELRAGRPFVVEMDEGDKQVQVYFG